PATFERGTRPFSEVKKEYDRRIAELGDWLEAARRYQLGGEAVEKDWKLEALAAVVDGRLPLMIQVDDERGIRDAVSFTDKEGVRLILLSARDAWKVADVLAEKQIPVILGPTLELPRHEDEPYDQPFVTAAELHRAGVRVVFASFSSSNSRLLPYEVGNAVAYGLPHEEGLKAITLYPAQLFGVGDELGSIEEGKVANLIVTDGDPLEIATQIRYLFIKGKLESLENKHLQLYEKYRARE
ncbi:MAG TPA: amidohydrolase family protein, partial [Vicinamibacteria bacterium]|nr:amidohydrolase family protein [Vicinamibacteria bacterium]